MSTTDEVWADRLHAAVDDHPAATEFDVEAYVVAGRERAARRTRLRRQRATALVLAAGSVAVVAVVAAVDGPGAPPVVPAAPTVAPGTATDGWVAIGVAGAGVHLLRPGDDARPLEIPGGDGTEACPAWSPDGTRLVVGRTGRPSASPPVAAELVVVPVDRAGTAGTPTVVPLDGFDVLDGFDPHPCGTWSPDGRWVALAGTGEVWVVDVVDGQVRRLPDLRPSDLEWRPGSDELTIAGDVGQTRGAPTRSTPMTVYALGTGQLRRLGTGEAAAVTWSPDGATLAFTGGEGEPGRLWLVDHDGTDERLLVDRLGQANHGVGPVWSPTGERIAYQRLVPVGRENHEVVLVDVADGTETAVVPPVVDGGTWYPDTVTWSPDGRTLLYSGWAWTAPGVEEGGGMLAVPADAPEEATVLSELGPGPDSYSHRWSPPHRWGRQPGG